MVDLTPEQMRRLKHRPDDLDPVDRAVAGPRSKQLLFAMDSSAALLERFRLLSGFAVRGQAICERYMNEDRTAMLLIQEEIKWLQRKFDALGTGPSRLMRVVK